MCQLTVYRAGKRLAQSTGWDKTIPKCVHGIETISSVNLLSVHLTLVYLLTILYRLTVLFRWTTTEAMDLSPILDEA